MTGILNNMFAGAGQTFKCVLQIFSLKKSSFGSANVIPVLLVRDHYVTPLMNVGQVSERNKLFKQSDISYHQVRWLKADKLTKIVPWTCPQKIPIWVQQGSGDLESIPPVDNNRPVPAVAESAHLTQVDDVTRRVLSLEFSKRNQWVKVYADDLVRKVQMHRYDFKSYEAKIAKVTAHIRNMQRDPLQVKRNSKMKVTLKESVEHRNKLLRKLRKVDYRRFEWLLEKLNIVFRPYPEKHGQRSRKKSIARLVEQHCEKVRQKRLLEYRHQLEAQQPAFLEERRQKLEWLEKEEEELNLPSSIDADTMTLIDKPKVRLVIPPRRPD